MRGSCWPPDEVDEPLLVPLELVDPLLVPVELPEPDELPLPVPAPEDPAAEPWPLEPLEFPPPPPPPELPLDCLLPFWLPNGSLYWLSPALCASAAVGKASAATIVTSAAVRRVRVTARQASQTGGGQTR